MKSYVAPVMEEELKEMTHIKVEQDDQKLMQQMCMFEMSCEHIILLRSIEET